MRRISFVLAVITLVFLGNQSATNADEAGPIPGLPWIHEGTAVTSSYFAAKLAGLYDTFKPDYNGSWVGPDGKHYDRITHQGATAEGLVQNSVVCIDGSKIILKSIEYTTQFGDMGYDPVRKPARQGGEKRMMVNARDNALGKAPDLLAGMTNDLANRVFISRVRWPEGTQIVDAIRIDSLTPKERILVVYDARTGLGLHLSSVSDIGEGDSMLMEYDFLTCRDLQVPWANEPIPQAVRNLTSLHLSGRVVPIRRFAFSPAAVTLSYTVNHAADRWISFDSISTFQAPRQMQSFPDKQQTGFYGSCEFGGLWIGPAAAASLQPGQILDSDPITKMKVSVSKVDQQSIGILESNTSSAVQNIYDRSTGLLVEHDLYDKLTSSKTLLTRDNMR